MGCDIHLHVERMQDGQWKEVEIPENLMPTERSYRLFGFLADVRADSDVAPQFADRGIPRGCSIANELINDPDMHSHTYAYLDEILRAPWQEAGLEHCYFRAFFFHVLPRLILGTSVLYVEEERIVRAVMYFDN